MKPFIKLFFSLTLTLAPLLSQAQSQDWNQRLKRLERLIDRQSSQIQQLESRIRYLEEDQNSGNHGGNGNHGSYPPIHQEPGQDCQISYNDTQCATNYYSKYTVTSNGKSLTDCIQTLDTAISRFNSLKNAGVCRSASRLNQCQLSYNSAQCKTDYYSKYIIEANGKSVTSCLQTQDGALAILKKLREAQICY